MIFTVSGRQLASSKWKVKLLSPPMYLQLQKRQGPEHNWMSKNNFSSLSCVVRKDWRCSVAEALLTVLARPSARPFGPDDSCARHRKGARDGCLSLATLGTQTKQLSVLQRPRRRDHGAPSGSRNAPVTLYGGLSFFKTHGEGFVAPWKIWGRVWALERGL